MASQNRAKGIEIAAMKAQAGSVSEYNLNSVLCLQVEDQ
jgi:hypothetical protein